MPEQSLGSQSAPASSVDPHHQATMPPRTEGWAAVHAELARVVEQGLAENARLIRASSLDDGWQVVRQRGELIREVMTRLVEDALVASPPKGEFAIHLLGGSGRGEACPDSDVDLGVIVENLEEEEPFLAALRFRLKEFSATLPGVQAELKANAFQDLSNREHFNIESLVALLDARLIGGDEAFNSRIKEGLNKQLAGLNLELVFYSMQSLRDLERLSPDEPWTNASFDIKHGKGGLRNFQFPVWIFGAQHAMSSNEVYSLSGNVKGAPPEPVMEAAGVLLMARSWLALERRTARAAIDHLKPVMKKDDLMALREHFGADTINRIHSARQTIMYHREEFMRGLLERGIVVPDSKSMIVYGSGGLESASEASYSSPVDRFYLLNSASLRFGLPIEPSTLSSIRAYIPTQITPDRRCMEIFGMRGDISSLVKEWADSKVLDSMLPHFGELRNVVYDVNNRRSNVTPVLRAVHRLANLDQLEHSEIQLEEPTAKNYFLAQYRAIDAETLAAVRLALLIEDLPMISTTPGGINRGKLNNYLESLKGEGVISAEQAPFISFLLHERAAFVNASELSGDAATIERWKVRLEQFSEEMRPHLVRALSLVTFAEFDFSSANGGGAGRLSGEQWRNIQNFGENLIHSLYGITGGAFSPGYLDPLGESIGKALPSRLLLGPLVDKNVLRQGDGGREVLDSRRALAVINRLAVVCRSGDPQIELRRQEAIARLDIYAVDTPGLFWKIARALYEAKGKIRFVDLYNIAPEPSDEVASVRKLALDVIAFEPPPGGGDGAGWVDPLRTVLKEHLTNGAGAIADDTAEIIGPAIEGMKPKLTDLGNGKLKFSFDVRDRGGLLYAASRVLSERTDANIYSVALDGSTEGPVPRFNLYFESQTDLGVLEEQLKQTFPNLRLASQGIVPDE